MKYADKFLYRMFAMEVAADEISVFHPTAKITNEVIDLIADMLYKQSQLRELQKRQRLLKKKLALLRR